MEIDIDFEDDHPQRDLATVKPEYLRFLLARQTRIFEAMVDQAFQAVLDKVEALFNSIPNTDAADVAAARAEDLAALQALLDKLSAEETPVTVTPASISGTVGTAISGQLEATGGTGPYTFTSSGSSVVVASDGSYTTPASAAESDTLNVTATDSKGAVSAPASVSVSIA